MLSGCGLDANNTGTSVWESFPLSHTLAGSDHQAYVKPLVFAQTYTQLGTVLHQLFIQFYNTFTSVVSGFVHIIHIAYKRTGKLKEGLI